MKKLSSCLAIVLSVLLLIASLPLAAFAGTVADEYVLVFEGNADSELVNGDKAIVVAANSNITPDDSYLKVPANAANSYVKFAAEAPDGITYYAVFVDASAATEDVTVSPKFYDAEGAAIAYTFDEAWTISTVDLAEDFPEAEAGAIAIPAGFAGYVLFPADFAAAGLGITASADIFIDDIYAVIDENAFYFACTEPAIFGSLLVGSDAITVSYSKETKTVSWTAVEGAETYCVYLCSDDGVTVTEKGTDELSATYDEIVYAGGDAEVQVMAIAGDALYNAVLGISKATNIEYGEIAPYAVLNAGGDKSTLVNGALINTNWTSLGGVVAGTNPNSPTGVLNFTYPGAAFPPNSAMVNSTISYGFKVDNSCFTNAVIPASKVKSLAVYVDFSKTSVAEAWRVLAVKNTTTSLTANDNKTVANVRAPVDDRGYTIPVYDTGMGVYMHNTESTVAVTDNSAINVDATLINVKTGEVSSLAVTGSDTNANGALGGYCIPAGFVGYVCFNLDLPQNARHLSDIGYINLVRKGTVGENVAKTEDATTYAGFSVWPDNYNDPYAIGAWYAVTDIDTFAADVFAGEFGATGHGTCSAEATDGETTSITWPAVEGAVSYTANLFNASTKALITSKTVDTTSVDMGVLYTDYIFNVVAYDADGNVVAVLGAHTYEHVIETRASMTQEGYEYDKCVYCGNVINEKRTPVLGIISNITTLGSHNSVGIEGKADVVSGGVVTTDNSATRDHIVAEGIWGESQTSASLLIPSTFAGKTALGGWGPSLQYAGLQVWNGNGAGIALSHNLASAQAFGFYVDLGNIDSFAASNRYFDIAFSKQAIVNTESASHWKWILGSYRYDWNEYQQGNYFADANPVKLYNIETGEYTNAVLDFQDTLQNGAGFAIPKGFRGYVIIDMSSYNGGAMDLADVKSIRVDIHRNYTGTSAPCESEGVLKYPSLGGKILVYDNFFNINDIDAFEKDLEGYIAEVGTFKPNANMTLSSSYADATTLKLEAAGMDGVENISYNIYKMDANNDGYVLVKSVKEDTFSIADLSEGTYYIQAVGTLDDKVAASELHTFAICSHESYSPVVVKPTGTKEGYTKYVCDNCEHFYIDEESYVPALGVMGNVVGLNGDNMIPTSVANVEQEEGKWSRFVDGVIFASTAAGPSAKAMANIQTYVYGGIAVNMSLSDDSQGFGYYIDNTRVGGFVTGTWDSANSKVVTSAAGDYEKVYFDIVFRNSGTLAANSLGTTAQYVLGSHFETTAAGGSTAWKKGKYFEDGAVKLYNIDTGEYTTVEYDFGGTVTEAAGFAIPAGFRGYVIVDLTKYTGESVMPLASVKQIAIQKHGLYNNNTEAYALGITKYGGNAGGKLTIGYDNFFSIYDFEAFNAAPASYLDKFSASPAVNNDAYVDIDYADDATSATFTANGLGVTDGITYNLYKLAADEDTYELVGTATGATGTISFDHGVKYYVQAVYTDAANKTVTATPLQLVRATKIDDMSFGILRGESEYTLLKYFGTESTVVIPAAADGVGVVDIALDAFDETGANITELTTGRWIKTFKAGQFAALTNLKKVIFNTQNKPKSTATSANPVFSAEGIEVVINQGVTRVPEYMFYDCKVVSLTFAGDPTVEEIAKYAFYRNRIAGEIVIPDSVKTIGDAAFRGSLNATAITLGASVETIGNWAFGYSEKVTAVNLNSGLKTIGFWAFGHDKALTEVVIPEGVTSIGAGAFGATAVSAVTIPYSVEYIGTDIFAEVIAETTTVSVYNNSYAYIKANASGWTVNDLGIYYALAAETDFEVQDVEGGVEIIAYTGAGGYIEVPAEIGGKAVVALGEKAFYVSGVANRTIEGIKLPASCTYIGYQAVRATLALKVIDAQGVTTVADMAFLYSNIESATFADGASVSDSAFEGCEHIN